MRNVKSIVFASASALVLGGLQVEAATLLVDYDLAAPGGWTGTQVHDALNLRPNLTPDDGNPRVQAGPNTVPGDFGAPVYTASGAITNVASPSPFLTARDRPYMNFQKFGMLTGTSVSESSINTGLPGNANVGGYTFEGFFLLRTGYTAAENTGIGFTQGAAGENQVITVPRGTNTSLSSNSQVDNVVGGTQSLEQVNVNINAAIPRDQWFHFVKVHDPVLDQIRFYINGNLQGALTASLDPNSSALEYHAFTAIGNVGTVNREIRDIGYSLMRVYRGALTDAEILRSFHSVAFIPEPGSMALLGLTGFLAARRRRV